ncbi:hypothetical protein IKE83_01610 [Candidatus Saccharibacteria bacterium]|nr:hypothetical protein [Candidatus Saccharibacteria bacterium]
MIDWTFNFGWVIFGLLIAVAGGAIVVFYRQIADNMAGGINSYDKVKIVGIVTIALGLIIMANIHTLILSLLVQIIFKRNG